ncbi:hypothetical protein BMF94_0643 [Rhodotorula taiwanensis]|uniref:Uncharacterized protein n=1 Tax=Rhodotorula taiwanensis TaxID=741276 RepID=A0A2S5BI70_9BASI|nr:hypothetical protein BMF94_0643 [Rhodotorula taiwanensis]
MDRIVASRVEPRAKSSEQSELYQIAQYTCVYDALYRTVQCKPFVRTFMKQANGLMSEVTPFLNAGGPLPRAGLDVPPEARSERHVPIGITSSAGA